MIRELRKRIFWSIELSAIGVLFLILSIYNGIQYAKSEQEEWQMLSMVIEKADEEEGVGAKFGNNRNSHLVSNGEEISERGPGKGRNGHRGKDTAEIVKNLLTGEVGLVELDESDQIVMVSGFFEEYGEEEREQTVEQIVSADKEQGKLRGMKYICRSDDDGRYIALLDAGYFNMDMIFLAGISFLGLLLAGLLFGIIAYRLSVRIVKPVEETIRNQKQFIADASHELKTPVAVISANISVLEKEVGNNRWLDYIKEEGKRMTELVSRLLQLSKLDYQESDEKFQNEKTLYNLSDALLETALPFESIAFEQEISYELKIPENIMFTGVQEDMKQIVGILLDNALKHTEKQGQVLLYVEEEKKKWKRKMVQMVSLHVRNTGEEIPKEVLPFIFNRFYKMDDARKYEENSFGLGLAIAKSLAERNGGTIAVRSENRVTEFIVTLTKY